MWSSFSLRTVMSAASTPGPLELAMRTKLASLLNPLEISIRNDSWQHRHHEAMRGNSNPETHFTINVVSDAFKGKTTMQRHRMIYAALSHQFSEGLHALSLKTKTPEEIAAAPEGVSGS